MTSTENEQILQAIGNMRPGSPVRRLAELVLSNAKISVWEIQSILRAMTISSKSRQKENVESLKVISNANWSEEQRAKLSSALEALVAWSIYYNKPDNIARRWALRAIAFSAISLIAYLAVYTIISPTHWKLGAEFLFSLLGMTSLLTLAGSFVSAPLSVFVDKRRLRNLCPVIECLGRVGRPACISTVATAFGHRPLRDAAAVALKNVAIRVRPEYYGRMPGRTVPALCQALSCADYATMLVILRVLGAIGDGRAIKSVERIQVRPPRPEAGRAATKLLNVLRQRDIESRTSAQLLRASTMDENSVQELLRGATGTLEDGAETLVRASGMADG